MLVQITLKRFINDIIIKVIEVKLISPLGSIFFPVIIFVMPAELVTCIVNEFKKNCGQRE